MPPDPRSKSVKDGLDYGPRLSETEYQERIASLYAARSSEAKDVDDTNLRRRELDLSIDFRLGRDFPVGRREALWKIQQEVEAKRIRLVFSWLWHWISYRWLHRRSNKLAGYLVNEYSKVLSKEELEVFFELKEGEHPSLPIDGLK